MLFEVACLRVCPGQYGSEHREHGNDNDDDHNGFCRHGRLSYFTGTMSDFGCDAFDSGQTSLGS
jgi:hypothetical protein